MTSERHFHQLRTLEGITRGGVRTVISPDDGVVGTQDDGDG